MTSSFQPSISQAQEAALPMHSPAEFEARIAALWVFPIKSCAGISVPSATLTATGLAHDRAWMVVDADGLFVSQRECARMVLVQPALTAEAVLLRALAVREGAHVAGSEPAAAAQFGKRLFRVHGQGRDYKDRGLWCYR